MSGNGITACPVCGEHVGRTSVFSRLTSSPMSRKPRTRAESRTAVAEPAQNPSSRKKESFIEVLLRYRHGASRYGRGRKSPLGFRAVHAPSRHTHAVGKAPRRKTQFRIARWSGSTSMARRYLAWLSVNFQGDFPKPCRTFNRVLKSKSERTLQSWALRNTHRGFGFLDETAGVTSDVSDGHVEFAVHASLRTVHGTSELGNATILRPSGDSSREHFLGTFRVQLFCLAPKLLAPTSTFFHDHSVSTAHALWENIRG